MNLYDIRRDRGKKYNRKDADLTDSQIDINGTLTANGAVYTTEGGAALVSSKGTGVYSQAGAVGTETETYQYTQSGSSVSEQTIAITPAKLLNADASYTETSSAAAGSRFVYANGKWQLGKESYTVTWVNDDGTVLATDTVKAGETPKYAGATPTKESTAQYSYEFSGWTPEVSTANADVTYKATYKQTTNKYTITWKNADGTELGTDQVEYGTVPAYSGATPTKAADAQYSYTFKGWDPEVASVTGDATYTAQFDQTVNTYTVTWENEDGTVLATDEMAYGVTPSYTGETPTKAADAQYAYEFNGWTPEVAAVTGNVTYKATYKQTVNTYTVTWANEDGTTLKTDTVEYGATPSYTGETPTKVADAQYTYAFAGWSPAIDKVTGDVTYTAQFDKTINTDTVTWVDENGTVLETDADVAYGTTPSYDGATPAKQGDAQYTYTFAGWTPEVSEVTSDVTYKATYTQSINKYTITWKDSDGTELETDQVEYGTVPTYQGATPTKAGDAEYSYKFAGWKAIAPDGTQSEVAAVTGDATYTATYTQSTNAYTVQWVDENGNVLEADENVAYGTTPSYDGETPTKAADAQYTYTFAGWAPAVDKVTGNVTYTSGSPSAWFLPTAAKRRSSRATRSTATRSAVGIPTPWR